MRPGIKAQISVTIDETILHWIDNERHNINRSNFINSLLQKKYDEFKKQFDWEKEEQLAEEDIKQGRVKKCKTAEEAIEWLNS